MRQKLLAAEYRKNGKRPPGRPRSEQARQAILRNTLKLLGKNGSSDFKIEEVAARASVGKATVYRWWPNKGALIADAFASSTTRKLRFPDT
jgi:AcrR family transcriptional regulator